jgi:NTP pyrophosphatase (non-canonical NTP hydrolase)/FMN phosphatase YigB (HAD superfamily)
MVLYLVSELDELLRCTAWKKHRRQYVLPNPAQVKEELTDVFKYWISLCQIWDLDPTDMMREYWRKSMVVQQRYSEEHLLKLSEPIALIDVDGVLANYRRGVLNYIINSDPPLELKAKAGLLLDHATKTPYINAQQLGISESAWQQIKHSYRVNGYKARLDAYDDAEDFLLDLRLHGYTIVIITSRPIDKYPTLFSDTLEWLQKYNLQYDAIWWTHDKRERVALEDIADRVAFSVEDDLENALDFAEMGIKSYHLCRPGEQHQYTNKTVPNTYHSITTLKEIEIA